MDAFSFSDNLSVESGSLFHQEYMVPRTSKSFFIFYSRGLLENVAEDFSILKNWIFNGIQHGEMGLRLDLLFTKYLYSVCFCTLIFSLMHISSKLSYDQVI